MNAGKVVAVKSLVVPFICDPMTCQPTVASCKQFHRLHDLKLAHPANTDYILHVDLLISSDHYWKQVTGQDGGEMGRWLLKRSVDESSWDQ